MTARALIVQGDALRLPLADASVDAVCTDPPYGLEFMGQEWDRPWAVSPAQGVGYAGRDDLHLPSHRDGRNANCRACGGRARGAKRCQCARPEWDRAPSEDMRAYQAWCEQWAAEALRVLKPGGHLLAFGGTRTYHRLACGIEDAGFEIRDSCLDCHADPQPDYDPLLGVPGLAWLYGQGFPKSRHHLKPAFEPIVVARKPLAGTVAANLREHGTGPLFVAACRVARQPGDRTEYGVDGDERGWANEVYDKLGPAAYEPDPAGRWPANVVLDAEAAELLDRQSGETVSRQGGSRVGAAGNGWRLTASGTEYNDRGGASRFFYTRKARSSERVTVDGISHPTQKPLALMRWLVRLVTPAGGLVLDQFAGSGTTGEAAMLEGVDCVLVERDARYLPHIRVRTARLVRRRGRITTTEPPAAPTLFEAAG